MGIKRQALLTPEVEAQLREEMHEPWLKGMPAKDIAKKLRFGDPDTNYRKLKVYHVWFYRSKFHFHRRRKVGGIKKGQSRYKHKREEIMPFPEFRDTLNQSVPKADYDYARRKRAYLILLYWTPLRKSEIYERMRKDFKIKDNMLKIDLYRKKKFYRKGAKTEPFYVPLKMPMLDEVIDWIEEFEKNERPFNFGSWTAWDYVRDIFKDLYPHFFRSDWITKAVDHADNPKSLITDLLRDTGLDLATVTTYVLANKKFKTSISDRELELLAEQGIEI